MNFKFIYFQQKEIFELISLLDNIINRNHMLEASLLVLYLFMFIPHIAGVTNICVFFFGTKNLLL